MVIQERYRPVDMAANASVTLTGNGIGGFACKTAGTFTITDAEGVILFNAFPVSAGQVYGLPAICGIGAVVTLGGGASGTLLKQ